MTQLKWTKSKQLKWGIGILLFTMILLFLSVLPQSCSTTSMERIELIGEEIVGQHRIDIPVEEVPAP